MAKKPDPLSDLLAKSFTPPAVTKAIPTPEADPEASQTPVEAPTGHEREGRGGEAPVRRKSALQTPPEPLQTPPASTRLSPPEFQGVKKTTVSFYAAEQDQVDKILDTLLKARRHRGGFSDAIKIALRLCPMDPDQIARAWDEARAADKRTQRAKT